MDDDFTWWQKAKIRAFCIIASPIIILEAYYVNREKGRGRMESIKRALKGYQ